MNPYLNDHGELTGFDADWVLDLIGVPHWTSSAGRILYSGEGVDEEQRIEYVAYLIGVYYRAFRIGMEAVVAQDLKLELDRPLRPTFVAVDKKLVRELIPTLQGAMGLVAMSSRHR